ncbi:hypothetical protein E2C01_039205 [Portunus trituberculatus]|uniref:Endonuclease/exonuclease/phosphatase domain-containing protein n=1 Tax=Portunus trituberculatus TaxID=210409 RepID=A0A5B7FJ89_PORTR|nr:hypothetical protein [Portunus trituberculatus]
MELRGRCVNGKTVAVGVVVMGLNLYCSSTLAWPQLLPLFLGGASCQSPEAAEPAGRQPRRVGQTQWMAQRSGSLPVVVRVGSQGVFGRKVAHKCGEIGMNHLMSGVVLLSAHNFQPDLMESNISDSSCLLGATRSSNSSRTAMRSLCSTVHCRDGMQVLTLELQVGGLPLLVYNISKSQQYPLEAGELLTLTSHTNLLVADDFNTHHPMLQSPSPANETGCTALRGHSHPTHQHM